MRFFFLIIIIFLTFDSTKAQIIVDNTAPYDNPEFLVNSILLGGGITTSNIIYQGDSAQIGFFNAINTSLGIDSGIVMCTGDVYALDPINGGGFPQLPNIVTDPDLLAVANSVPGMIGQTFSVSSINDVAVLEFDFIPTSDSLEFRYAFGSQEYFAFENTQYNDVFGFFLSGPGIAGPWTNGAINLAVVPNTNPPLPITISSVNSAGPMNQQYFVDNQNGLDTIADADGYTTVLTAQALVECGETYHIRLAIADGSDQGLSSYVWLEAGSFYSHPLSVVNNLSIDSTVMEIPCNTTIELSAVGGVGATYQWFDSTSTVIGTDSTIIVGEGSYVVSATIQGCDKFSDTIIIISDDAPFFDLGPDYNIPCNTTTFIDPVVTGGLGISSYQYIWNNGSTDTLIEVSEGSYILEVDDGTACTHIDTIIIIEDVVPNVTISGGGSICDDGTTSSINFSFNGLLPWDLTFTNGVDTSTFFNIATADYLFATNSEGVYGIILADDVNECIADTIVVGVVEVIVNPLPVAVISPDDITVYLGDAVDLVVGEYINYEWFTEDDSLLSFEETLEVSLSGKYKVLVEDENGCTDMSDLAIVRTEPLTELFVPTVFTPNGDNHNELFLIQCMHIVDYVIMIHDRWGELIFEGSNITKSWDGTFNQKKVPEGTYYYSIEVFGEDNEKMQRTGTVNVIY